MLALTTQTQLQNLNDGWPAQQAIDYAFDFQSLNKYLNDNLRQYGSSKSSADLLKASTGYDSVQPNMFLDYLKDKYLNQPGC